MNREKYMVIYMLVVGVLFVHLFIAKKYSEPYPSFVFPSFSKVERLKEVYNIPVSYLYAIDQNRDTFYIDRSKAFANSKVVHVTHILKTISQKEQFIAAHQDDRDKPVNKSMLQNILKERARFISATTMSLKQLYPDKDFCYLLLVNGVKKYDVQKKSLSDTLSSERTTLISLL